MYELHKTAKIVGSVMYNNIMESAKEEANKSMFMGGRNSWNEEDHEVFSKTFFQLMKEKVGYIVK